MIPTESEVSSYQNYLRRSILEGLKPLVLAAAIYFAIAMLLLVRFAPRDWLPWLLLQKALYIALAIAFVRHLQSGRYPLSRSESYTGLVLVMCLSSALLTAWAGLHESFSAYSAVLLLGIAMCEISWRRAGAFWSTVWLAWLLVYHAAPQNQVLLEFSKLFGIQLVAIPAMALRLRMTQKQYSLVVELASALRQSEQIRQTLDAAVEERTAELREAHEKQVRLHEQLIQSQKMESLGRLAGGVAHDFNNILTVILGDLELIRCDLPESERLEFVMDAESAVQRAAEVTGQLLAFSRKEVLRLHPIQIQAVIQDGLRMVERLIGEDIQLCSRLDCPDVQIAGDRMRLQQVLINLVVNARDAMPEGGRLSIELEQRDNFAVLRVTDTGCGMDRETQQRILEPFFTTKPVGQGTGLGLSTVDGIVSMHLGQLQVESEPGKGTSMSVLLPIVAHTEVDSTKIRRGTLVGSAQGRVLLVEDDEQVRNLTSRVLKMLGYEVCVQADADKTLKWLEGNRDCDLLITDVIMPGLDGGRLAQAVRQRIPNLPVLFISGYADDRLAQCGITPEEENFLGKPFTPAQLQRKLSEVLSAKK